jgi:hypothetical protein
MDHIFFRLSGTLGGHLVTDEGEFGCSENTLRLVYQDPIPLKLVDESPLILLCLLE